jgi:hypothetical protein
VRRSPGGGHGQSWCSMGAHGELAGEGKEGEWEEAEGGTARGAPWGGGGGAMGAVGELGAGYPSCSAAACCT